MAPTLMNYMNITRIISTERIIFPWTFELREAKNTTL